MYRLLLCLLCTFAALGDAETPTPATLVVDGQPLFTFRARVGSVQPADRVRLIGDRIERLARDPRFDLQTIKAIEDKEAGWEVFAGENLLLVITNEDARLDKHPPKFLAESLALRLREILSADRLAKSPRQLAIHALYAVLYTLGLLLLLWGMARLFRRTVRAIQGGEGTLIPPLRIKNLEILPAQRIAIALLGVLKATRLVATLTLLYFFVPLVLSLFPWTAELSPRLLGYIWDPLQQIGRGFLAFVPNLFFIALNVLIARYALKFVRWFFDEIGAGNLKFSGFYPDWAAPTYQLVRLAVIAFTAVVVFPYIPGSNSPAFQGVSVFLGVLVSFGSSSAVANVIAGIVITYMRSFRPGDRVKIADTTGDIVEKTLFVTRVRTVKNVDITIPNALVLGNHIINYSALAPTDGLILNTEVTIGYDAPWRKVHELLLEAARKTEGILPAPSPFVLQTALEDSYVRYQINAYTRQANGMANIYSALHQNIQDSFNQAGVEIMSPAYSALRDGNTVTIPADKRPVGYTAPSFRVEGMDSGNAREVEETNPRLDA